MRIIACIICFTILTFPSHAQGYYEEGTRWTELKLDTLKYESWFTEVNDGGTTKYIPNYERTDFYIKGAVIITPSSDISSETVISSILQRKMT